MLKISLIRSPDRCGDAPLLSLDLGLLYLSAGGGDQNRTSAGPPSEKRAVLTLTDEESCLSPEED